MTLIRLKRYDEAIAELKKVLELDPNFLLAHDRLATAYVLKGQYDNLTGRTLSKFGVPPQAEPAYLNREIPPKGGTPNNWGKTQRRQR